MTVLTERGKLRQAATARCRDAISRAAAELKAAKERETTVAKQVREAERAERDARELLQRAEQAVGRLRPITTRQRCAVEAARVKVDEVPAVTKPCAREPRPLHT